MREHRPDGRSRSYRLAELNALETPDLWADIVARARADAVVELVVVDADASGEVDRRRARRLATRIVAVAAAVVIFAGGVLLGLLAGDGRRVVVSGREATAQPWSEVAAFDIPPAVPGAAWVVALDAAVGVTAHVQDPAVNVFDARHPSRAPQRIDVPPVAGVGVIDGTPVVLGRDGRLVVIERGTARLVAQLDPVEGVADLAGVNGRVWVARGGDSPLTVVDLSAGDVDTVEAVRGVDVVQAASGRVWAASRSQSRVVQLDALDDHVVGERQLEGVVEIQPGGGGDAWILHTSSVGGEVVHLDAQMTVLATAPVRSTTSAFVADEHSLWTLDRGRLAHTALGREQPEQIVTVGAAVGRLARLGDALYVFGSDVRVFRPGEHP
jgi:hypothetical protein